MDECRDSSSGEPSCVSLCQKKDNLQLKCLHILRALLGVSSSQGYKANNRREQETTGSVANEAASRGTICMYFIIIFFGMYFNGINLSTVNIWNTLQFYNIPLSFFFCSHIRGLSILWVVCTSQPQRGPLRMVSRRLYASVRMDSKKPQHLRISQLSTSYHNPLPNPSMKKLTMWCPGKALTWGLRDISIMMAFIAIHPDEIAWECAQVQRGSPRWRTGQPPHPKLWERRIQQRRWWGRGRGGELPTV